MQVGEAGTESKRFTCTFLKRSEYIIISVAAGQRHPFPIVVRPVDAVELPVYSKL